LGTIKKKKKNKEPWLRSRGPWERAVGERVLTIMRRGAISEVSPHPEKKKRRRIWPHKEFAY